MVDTVTTRQLNRTTLARQLLVKRSVMSALDAIEHLVGMQAQAPLAPYFGLWSRLEHFTADDLSQLLLDRLAVRVVVMRGTIHLVSAADCHSLRPLMQPIMDRDLRTNAAHARALAGVDLVRLEHVAGELLAASPLTPKDLGARLAPDFPTIAPASLAHAARDLLSLVQVPPRAVWGKSGQPRLTTASAWLGAPSADLATIDEMVVRYLNAYGPALVNDIQAWCGLTRLREVTDRLGTALRTYRDEDGGELLDVADGTLIDDDVPAPVRMLAEYDNIVLSHADRRRMMTDETRAWMFAAPNGIIPRALLVDGFVAGTWKITSTKNDTIVDVHPVIPLVSDTVHGVIGEGARLVTLTGNGKRGDVRVHATAAP